jgi:gamma-glutamyltranspeptidase
LLRWRIVEGGVYLGRPRPCNKPVPPQQVPALPDTPTFSTAAVAAPHRLAAVAGRDVLATGGSALEATVAMAATIAVVYPHMNAIGGDGFWLVREPGGRVRSILACGPAASSPRPPASPSAAIMCCRIGDPTRP